MEEVQDIKDSPEERKWCVYIHRNIINNKSYIGITSRKPKDRWGYNGNHYTHEKQPVFYNAIQKYGWNNFEHIIWGEDLSEQEAKDWEVRLILLFKTNCCKYKNPEYGYNMTDGGEGTHGRSMSEKTKQKIRACQIKRLQNPEERNKLSCLAKERFKNPKNHPMYGSHRTKYEHPMYGKHHTEETKDKIRQSKCIPIICIETKVAYKSRQDAEYQTNIKADNIWRSIRRGGTAGGYHWMTKEDYDKITNNTSNDLTNSENSDIIVTIQND